MQKHYLGLHDVVVNYLVRIKLGEFPGLRLPKRNVSLFVEISV